MQPCGRWTAYATFLLMLGGFGCSSEKPVQAPQTSAAGGSFSTSVDPSAGAGNEVILTARYQASARQTVTEVRVLLNATLDGSNACYVYHRLNSNEFLLIDDAGTSSRKAATGQTKIENSQCSLDVSRSSALISGPNVTLTLALRFKPVFVGARQVFLYAEALDGTNSGLKHSGTFSVTF